MFFKIALLIGLCNTQSLFCQYGIVDDKDGFVNVRRGPSINDKIIDTFHNGKILYFLDLEDQKSEWLDCAYSRDKSESGGYIHKSKIKFINSFKKIKPILTKTEISFSNENTKILVRVEAFIAKNHKLKWYKNDPEDKNSNSWLALINGLEIHGADGTIPREKYGKSTIKYKGESAILPTETFYNPNKEYHELFWDDKIDTYYLTTSNGDGAGAYVAIWVISMGKVIKRICDIPF